MGKLTSDELQKREVRSSILFLRSRTQYRHSLINSIICRPFKSFRQPTLNSTFSKAKIS